MIVLGALQLLPVKWIYKEKNRNFKQTLFSFGCVHNTYDFAEH